MEALTRSEDLSTVASSTDRNELLGTPSVDLFKLPDSWFMPWYFL